MYISGKRDETIGLNGSFEIIDSGYPVNWKFHGPPIKKGDAKVLLDTRIVKDGKHSLKIVAHHVRTTDRIWKRPGFKTTIPVESGKKYRLSFFLRNNGCKFYVGWICGIGWKKETRSKYVVRSKESFDEWRFFQDTLTISELEDRINLNFVITEPGTLWVDDVRVEEVHR